MTFVYEVDPYSLEKYRMYKYELSTSYVEAFESYCITDIKTDRHDRNYIPRRFAGGQ